MVARVLRTSVDDFLVRTSTSESSIPSARLEQEEHRFGFRERPWALSTIGSPQQIQTRGLMGRFAKQNDGAGGHTRYYLREWTHRAPEQPPVKQKPEIWTELSI